MMSSRTASTRIWMARSGPHVRFLVIRAVIEYLSDAAASPIRDISSSLTGSCHSRDPVRHTDPAALRSSP